jgi:hypothetical protein
MVLRGGAFKREAVGLQCGGMTFMHCVGMVGLVIMLVVLLVMGGIRFFCQMFGLAGCPLELDLVVYMTYEILKSHLFFI